MTPSDVPPVMVAVAPEFVVTEAVSLELTTVAEPATESFLFAFCFISGSGAIETDGRMPSSTNTAIEELTIS